MVQSTFVLYWLADDDNDYDHQKRVRQTKEQGEYDGPDEDDRAVIRQEDEAEAGDLESENELRVNRGAEDDKPKYNVEDKLDAIDFGDMKEINPNLVKFTFDTNKGEWCEIELEV